MENIRALFIFEVLGRPPEHIKQALEKVVEKLGEVKGVDIKRKDFHEPKLIDDEKAKAKGFYTAFAEVEADVETLNLVFGIVVNMLPAHVEILKPDELRLKNFDLSAVLGELALKIHRYDDIAKAVMIERDKMIKTMKKMEDKIKELGGDLDFLKPEPEENKEGKEKENKEKESKQEEEEEETGKKEENKERTKEEEEETGKKEEEKEKKNKKKRKKRKKQEKKIKRK